ncbi:hypothetical protein BU25DRAFT_484959, partial [Macroventuria anomochaeta]
KHDLHADCMCRTEMFQHWYDLLHREGAYITIVEDKMGRTAMGGPLTYFTYPSQIRRHVYGYFFGPRYANVFLCQKTELLEQVAKLADEKGVQVVLQHVIKGTLDEEGHKKHGIRLTDTWWRGACAGRLLLA